MAMLSKVNGKYELTDLLKNMLRNMVALEQFMAFYVLMPGLRSIEKMELAVKIVKLSLQ